MNPFLSEADSNYRNQCEQFLQEHIAPGFTKGKVDLPALFNKLAASGYLGINVPKEFGGSAGSFVELVLLAESLAQVDASLALSIGSHSTVIELINEFGTNQQKSKYLPLLIGGKLLGTFAHNEGEKQINRLQVATQVREDAGGKSITGTKKLVINGNIANLVIVLANEAINSNESVSSLWLLDLSRSQSSKVMSGQQFLGLDSISFNDIIFDRQTIADEDRLAVTWSNNLSQQQLTEFQLDWAMSIMRTVQAATALGLLDKMMAKTVEFTKNHQKFSKPMTQSQAVQWKIADMATESTAARLLTYRCAWSKDADESEFVKYAAMCKSYATKAARIHSSEALQIFGQLIETLEISSQKILQDAKMLEITEGTNEEAKLLLAEKLGV